MNEPDTLLVHTVSVTSQCAGGWSAEDREKIERIEREGEKRNGMSSKITLKVGIYFTAIMHALSLTHTHTHRDTNTDTDTHTHTHTHKHTHKHTHTHTHTHLFPVRMLANPE